MLVRRIRGHGRRRRAASAAVALAVATVSCTTDDPAPAEDPPRAEDVAPAEDPAEVETPADAEAETTADAEAARTPQPGPVDTSDLPRSIDDEPVWTDVLVLADATPWPGVAFVAPDEELRVDNRDDVPHHLQAWDGSFELELGPGEHGTVRTPEPGAYPYTCLLHPQLRGDLDVG